jgi:hypothetical protein
MITTIIISALVFLIGFIGGYLYKMVLEQRQKPIMPYSPIYQQPPYIPFDMPCQESIEKLSKDLRKVQLEISIHPFANIQSAKLNSKESVEIYERLQKEYKELKLKELALAEKINKINKDNGVSK